MPRIRLNVAVLPCFSDLALDGAPEQVHHLRDEEHGRDAVLAQAVEDHARVPAAHVEDVRPDIHPVEQGDLLLQAVRQGEQRDQPVLHRLEDPVEGHRARERVAVAEHHALGAAGRSAREDELVDVLRSRALPSIELRLPICGERLVRLLGQAVHDGRGEPLQANLARVRGVPAAAQQQVDRARGLDDVGDGVGAHARVEGHVDQARHHRAEVDRRQGGRGGRPGQDTVAGCESQGAQTPGREAAAAQHLRVAPVERGAVVTAEAQRVAVPVPSGAFLQEIEQGLHGAAIVPALPRGGKCRRSGRAAGP